MQFCKALMLSSAVSASAAFWHSSWAFMRSELSSNSASATELASPRLLKVPTTCSAAQIRAIAKAGENDMDVAMY